VGVAATVRTLRTDDDARTFHTSGKNWGTGSGALVIRSYRVALGNDLHVTVDGGVATHTYPIIIQASQPEITVDIRGGVGAVPIRFEGLETPSSYVLCQDVDGQFLPLDQSVHGNDCWQTVYDTATNTYQMSFNLPLDGVESSRWVLKRTNHQD
jgi:hypothetical protein